MPVARKHLVRLDQTNLYHCISRCVRRSFLCGKDHYSGKSFEHRRAWIEQHLAKLSQTFCIEVAGYSIMDNHYHLVLRVDQNRAQNLSDADTIERWSRVYRLPPLIKRFKLGEKLFNTERRLVKRMLNSWRKQLFSISRFIGYINEHVARRANKEDECKGRFWEGRFKSQAILDDIALLKTLVYVDLNPVRAAMVEVPEQADYTSLKNRLSKESACSMMPFEPAEVEAETLSTNTEEETTNRAITQGVIPITFKDYLSLVDSTGRDKVWDKRGHIPETARSIFNRLGISEAEWVAHTQASKYWENCVIGSRKRVQDFAHSIKQKWCWRRGDLPDEPKK